MKKEMVSILVCMLLITTCIFIVPKESNVKAGTGEGEGGAGEMNLPLDYVWDMTKDFSDVNDLATYLNDIPRGRAWATAGETWTIDNILLPARAAAELIKYKATKYAKTRGLKQFSAEPLQNLEQTRCLTMLTQS